MTHAALTSFWHHAQPGPDWIQSRQLLTLYLVHSWDVAGETDRLDEGPAPMLAALKSKWGWAKADEALGRVQASVYSLMWSGKGSESPQWDSGQYSGGPKPSMPETYS